MVINPPIIVPSLPYTQVMQNFSMKILCAILSAAVVIILSLLVGAGLHKVMKSKGYKHNLALTLSLSAAASLVMFIRYGMSVTLVQGMFLFFVLLYASVSDITNHEVDDHIWVTVLALGLVSVADVGISSMVIGAIMVFVPQILTSLIGKRSVGGADIKLTTALAFLLGWQRGLATLVVGMFLAIIVMGLSRLFRRDEEPGPFALIPFISIAAMVAFLF